MCHPTADCLCCLTTECSEAKPRPHPYVHHCAHHHQAVAPHHHVRCTPRFWVRISARTISSQMQQRRICAAVNTAPFARLWVPLFPCFAHAIAIDELRAGGWTNDEIRQELWFVQDLCHAFTLGVAAPIDAKDGGTLASPATFMTWLRDEWKR